MQSNISNDVSYIEVKQPEWECTPCHASSPVLNLSVVLCLILTAAFFTYIQTFQETGKVIWYSHFLKNLPQFVVVLYVKGFSIISEADQNVFWDSLAFSMIQWMLTIWSFVPLTFLSPTCMSESFLPSWWGNVSWTLWSVFTSTNLIPRSTFSLKENVFHI